MACFPGGRFWGWGNILPPEAQGGPMRMLTTMRASQIPKFARFLEEHPDIVPEFIGDDASAYGFLVGKAFLSVDEMERLIDLTAASQPGTTDKASSIKAGGRR